jgi:tellurite resistance protein TerC
MSLKKAIFWSCFWFATSIVFAVLMWMFIEKIYHLDFFSHYVPKTSEVSKKIDFVNFEELILKKIKNDENKTFLLTCYTVDSKKEFYRLNDNISDEKKKRTFDIIESVEYKWVGFRDKKLLEFMTGYLLEKALSIDNLFVFLIIFTYFRIRPSYQRRVLNFGILGVIILRGVFIALGSAIVDNFHWVLYVFGLLLFYAAYQMLFGKDTEIDPEKNVVLKYLQKIIPIDLSITDTSHFFVKKNAKWHGTSLFIVLIVIETSDVVFAIDSIPAVFAITTDPFIVFSSNLFAIMGLRSLYFLIEKIQSIFKFVKYGVGVVLAFAGVKMFVHIDVVISLIAIVVIFVVAIALSIIDKNKNTLNKSNIDNINKNKNTLDKSNIVH